MKKLKGLLCWPLLMVFRFFHIGDLTPEEIARRRLSYTIAFKLLKAQRAHAAAIEANGDRNKV
jgi:hypothetical protein